MTHFNFRDIRGTKNIDVVAYARDKMIEHPDLKIYVGTDSQNHRKRTEYAVVIAFRYGLRGVHYIYHKEKVKKIRDKWARLWKEAEMTAEVAMHLRNNLVPVYAVELDFNKKPGEGSSSMVQPGVGYMLGLGFNNVLVKPDVQVAVKAANHIVQ